MIVMANIKDIAAKKKNLAATRNPVITGIPAPIEIAATESVPAEPVAAPLPEQSAVPMAAGRELPVGEQGAAVSAESPDVLSNSELFNALLSKEREYSNGRQTVILDTRLKAKLDILGTYTNVHISRILNNLLYLLFESNGQYDISAEISKYIARQQSSISKQFK